MDIKTFTSVASALPSDIAVLMRGPTGVGKSYLARQCAEMIDLPFIDVRGSTMSEGDVGGYPDIEGMKTTGVMTFCMPSWFMRACAEPVVLMLDELNRSLPGVQQSFFQLVLDRELGNDKNGIPYKLHPQTRVFAAVNWGAEYDVNDMDPALLRRFWVCDLEPSTEDWLDWAISSDIDAGMVDFIRQNPAHLRVDPSTVEPGTICPNPASWHRLADTLSHMGINPSAVAGSRPSSYYPVAMGFVGTEAAIAFCDFVENYESVVTAEDVLDNYKEKKHDIEALTNDRANEVIERLAEHCKDNKWGVSQAKNVAKYAQFLPGELMIQLWNKVSSTQNLPNIQKLHKLIGAEIVKAVQTSRNIK
jgi:hypothetical protein